MLAEYLEQEPDRNLRAAPRDLAALYTDMRAYTNALRDAGASHVFPVSLLGGLDTLSNEAASKISGYLATVARYLTLTDRFQKNKKGLSFFARHVLPRVLQVFALQLDACRHVWRFLSEVSSKTPSPPVEEAVSSSQAPAADFSLTAGESPLYSDQASGPLGALAQNLGFNTPTTPYASARAFGRRLLARVQVQLGALYSLSRGCLAASSLTFQTQYAEAQDRVEMGESPAAAFHTLKEECNTLVAGSGEGQGAGSSTQQAKEKGTKDKKRQDPRLRALSRGGDKLHQEDKGQGLTDSSNDKLAPEASRVQAAKAPEAAAAAASGASPSAAAVTAAAAAAADVAETLRADS